MDFIKKYLPPFLMIAVAIAVALFTTTGRNNERVKDELDKTTWKTYTDSNFQFRYPSNMNPTPSGDRTSFFDNESRTIEMEIYLQNIALEESEFSYLDFPQSGFVEIEGKKFIEIKAPNGFCEGQSCGRPFAAYTHKNNNQFLTFIFYGNDILSPQEKVILGGLKYN